MANTEQQPAETDEFDHYWRSVAKIQFEEAQKLKAEAASNQLGAMNDEQFRDHVRKKYGYDAGV